MNEPNNLALYDGDFKTTPLHHGRRHQHQHRTHFKSYYYFFTSLKTGMSGARPLMLPLMVVVIFWITSMWVVFTAFPAGKQRELKHLGDSQSSMELKIDSPGSTD
ncbi:MAG: hypothetical protein ABIP97_13185 [Chthoniobacterales bacterium]